MRSLVHSTKGFSAMIGGVFIVILTMVSLNAAFVATDRQNAMGQIIDKMTAFDTDRLAENVAFSNATIRNFADYGNGTYKFDFVLDNVGGITVNIARVYLYSKASTTLTMLDPQTTPSSLGFSNGWINAGESGHDINVRTNRKIIDGNSYVFKLATNRGRTFSYVYTQPTTTSSVVAKPLILFTQAIALPNPIANFQTGGNPSGGIWSIIVSNPTNATVRVFSAFIANPAGQTFGTITALNPTSGWQVFTTSGGGGGQPSQALVWSGTPITIGPGAAYNFTVKNSNSPNTYIGQPLSAGIQTDRGTLTTTVASTALASGNAAINTFFVPDASHTITYVYNGTGTSGCTSGCTGVTSGATKTFTLKVQNDGGGNLPANSVIKLTISVPAGWTSVTANSSQSGWGTVTSYTNLDKSTTLEFSSTATIASGSSLSFSFSATAPTVAKPTLYEFIVIPSFPGVGGTFVGIPEADVVVQVS